MGGNALTETKTRRYAAKEYFELAEEVTHRLLKAIPWARVAVIPAYRAKESFGDLDVLVEDLGDNLSRKALRQCYSSLGITELVRAKPFSEAWQPEVETWSVGGFGELQVDLIFVPTRYFRAALSYYSYNDLGNLMGRVADSMGLKYGHKGLSYTLFDPENEARRVKELVLTTEPQQAFEFLGYDYHVAAKGFETLQDVLVYATTTPYFNPDFYRLENRNHTSRTRDKKRPTYRAFLEYLEEQGIEKSPLLPTPEQQLERAKQVFPEFAKELAETIAEFTEFKRYRATDRQAILSKFGPKAVQELTGLPNDLIGIFMARLRETALEQTGQSISDYTKAMSPEEIQKWVLQVFQAADAQAELRFNGITVSQHTGIKGKRLEALVGALRKDFGKTDEEFQLWLLTAGDEEFHNWIVDGQSRLDPQTVEAQLRRDAKMKFNTGLVSSLTGLEDEPLWALMEYLRGHCPVEGKFHHWVVSATDEEIKQWIEAEYANYCQGQPAQ